MEASDFHCILFSHHSQTVLKEFHFIFLSVSPKNKALRTSIIIVVKLFVVKQSLN